MRKLFLFVCILATACASKLHAQTVIDGKHWYRVSSDSGRVVVPANCVVTAIGVNLQSDRSAVERIFIDKLSYSLKVDGGIHSFGFTGEIFSGDKPMNIFLAYAKGSALNNGTIVVTYYN